MRGHKIDYVISAFFTKMTILITNHQKFRANDVNKQYKNWSSDQK